MNNKPKTKLLTSNRLVNKLSYASGDIYGGGAFLIFSLLFMNFLVLVEGLPVVATTIIIFIGRIWDAITDSIMGIISDRTRSKLGRRRIYFLIGIIPVFVSFFMLFYSFGIQTQTAKIVYYAISYMVFGTVFSIVMVPYNAILSDMTSDYNERTSFTTIRMLFSGGAALICAVIPSIIIKSFGAEEIGFEQIHGYLIMGLIFGAIFGGCWFFVFLGTWERKELPKPEKVPLKNWLTVFSNKAYRNFLGIFLSFQIAVDLVLALFIFYVDIVVLQYQNYELIVGTLLVCSVLLMVFQGKLAEKKGKAYPLYIGIPVWMISTLVFIWLGPGVPIITLCILAALIAVGSSAGNLSTWSMLADIYDIDEICTGKRQEGLYSGMTTFLRKFASGVAILLMGVGLQAMGFDHNRYTILKETSAEFDPAIYAQSNIVTGIKWMFVLIPFILLLICLLFAIKNKITKRRFDAVLKGIDEFKTNGNIDALTEQETADVLIATGMEKAKLWGRG
ncbi:MAG: MFS transporter [Treponema sp.]|jgi:oligogalacturonide transporter|nr:MFS transporter [Treponema sp.]